MDLSLPVADFPTEDELRFKLLARAAMIAVCYQKRDNSHLALTVKVRPFGWRQALLGRSRSMRVWLLMDTPFDGLCVGEDRKFYQLKDDEDELTVTHFEITARMQADVLRVTDVLFDMGPPTRW